MAATNAHVFDFFHSATSQEFAETNWKMLFRNYNTSASGWLSQGEFVAALSKWQLEMKDRLSVSDRDRRH